ncbi:hypothetical protein I3F58_05980 [Streptomyces sp. MUM 203J]|uniref:hypothetical protein n=1 Tax=Streptomyces sp. MUM 203J TaxID=2791990 RepID=UPI001F032F75|nr:hypothetical protein [Streptomyces sp. MUM 203J]MCH0539112.1 hypothetical protein [Streptomyces sp. MUM 203J]
MEISHPGWPGRGAALVLGAVLALTACGEQRAGEPAAGGTESAGAAVAAATPGAGTPGAGTASPPPPEPSPYVAPGAGDGAPHYAENNAHRRPREMSPAGEERARKEAGRIEPVLKRLWEAGTWDPGGVRTALLRLGYEEERAGAKSEPSGGTLSVREMNPRWKEGGYVTPEGARIGLRVGTDACVTAFVQKSNYLVQVNGPYPEHGCFEPPFGH